MLQKSTAFDALPARQEGSRRTPGSASDLACELVVRLRGLGLAPGTLQSASGITAAGADLQVWPAQIAQSDMTTRYFLRRVAALTHNGVPYTLSLRELGPGDSAIQILEEFCSRLRASLGADKALMSRIGLSLHSHQIPLKAYFLITRALLGNGPRYIILDSLQMQHHNQARVQEETDRNWSFLWRQRNSVSSLIPAYGASVRTGCPLLADEASEAILPQHGIQVPAGSAWLPVSLHLTRFADDRGRIRWPILTAALESCIDLGDQLLDLLSWSTASQRADAWMNRRLGVHVTGIGDLVRKRGMDAASLDCLQWADETILRVRKTLWDRSHVVAGQTEILPALTRADPTGDFCDHTNKQNWQRRWRRALASAAVKNRNLLVMSPYSVLPEGGDGQAGFTDLLPVLAHADAYAFADQPPLCGWNVEHFRKFHTRAWAVMQRRNACSLIADGV
jgi:hypothetical protein